MADMVSSAVIQETVSQILSGVVQRYEEKNEASDARWTVERLEMAQTRLQAAVDTSDKWLITDASLLRWRKKLRHAAEECDDALHKCRQRMLEDERHEREVRSLPVHRRVLARAANSSIFSSFMSRRDDDVSSDVRRFEWFADGAGEFLRFVELGGIPRRRHPMPYDSLIVRHLFDGKKLQQKIVGGDDDECPLYLLWVPFSTSSSTAEHAIQASLSFIQKDSRAPDGNFFYGVILQVSESTDILGVAIRCLQVFPPHLRSVVEVIRRKVSQLPTLDFSWVPLDNNSCQREHWSNLHSLCTRWFRPDPLCCKQHGHRVDIAAASTVDASLLEPIIHVNLLCQIPCSKYMASRKRTLLSEPKVSSEFGSPYLQVGVTYMPHGSSSSSSEDTLLLADKSSAVSELHGGKDHEKYHLLHTDVTLEELNETMLLKASDYFRHNAEAAIHQMVWRSRHGCAYIEVRKKSMEQKPSSASSSQQISCTRKTEVVQIRDQDLSMRAQMVLQFLNTWGAQAPARIRNLIMKWVQKEMEIQMQHQR